MPAYSVPVAHPLLAGGGEMGKLTRSLDWSQTPIGTPDQWPRSLMTIVSVLLNAQTPMLLWWGPTFVQFYNDACIPALHETGKHPAALGQSGAECLPETWPVIHPLLRQVMAGQGAVWLENQPMHRNEQVAETYWSFCFSPVIDDSGQIAGIMAVCQDTTHQVVAQRQLALSESRFHRFIEQAPVAVALFSGPEFVITLVNERVLEYWGRTREQVMDKPLFEALPEARGQGYEELLQGVVSTGNRFLAKEMTVTLQRNGQMEPTHIDFVYEPFFELDGCISGVLVVCTEITEQIQARQVLEEQTQLLERGQMQLGSLVENMPDVITRWDTSRRLLLANTAFGQKAGVNVEQLLGKTYSEIEPPAIALPYMDCLQAVLTSGLPQEYYNSVPAPNKMVYYYSRLVPEFDAHGQVVSVLSMARDITRLKELETELEQQVAQRTQELVRVNQDLSRSNDNLQQFAYVASHDLQEPLRKIQSFSTLVQEQYGGLLDATGNDMLRRMHQAGARMSSLISDLLVYSRVSTRQELFGLISLDTVIAGVLNTIEWTIEQRMAQIRIEKMPLVQGDERQLGQLFQNLISNAIKFTPVDQVPLIEITYQSQEADEVPPAVRPTGATARFHRISVSDQGVGFDVKYLDRIFQVFQRLHTRSEYPGTGVGLAICQRVVENHGGSITASSRPGQGATFRVYLPV